MDRKLITTLKGSGVVLLPTDTIPGIMTAYNNVRGLDRIFKLKKRDITQSIAVLIGSMEQLKLLVREVPPYAGKLMQKYWPGALTIVFPAVKGLPKHIVSPDGVAVRMPASLPLLTLISQLNTPLAATSINVHGEPPITDLSKVPARFAKAVDYIGTSPYSALDAPSTVVKFVEGKPVVLRHGAIKVKDQ